MAHKLEVKVALSADDNGELNGTAWPFGIPDRVGDMIEKGAFAGAQLPIPMLFSHRADEPIGVWTSIDETPQGLVVKGKLLIADVARAREVNALIREKAITGLSIGFVTKQAKSRRGGGRTISLLDLHEISLVSIPCHPGARLSGKDGADAIAIAEALNRASAAHRSKGK